MSLYKQKNKTNTFYLGNTSLLIFGVPQSTLFVYFVFNYHFLTLTSYTFEYSLKCLKLFQIVLPGDFSSILHSGLYFEDDKTCLMVIQQQKGRREYIFFQNKKIENNKNKDEVQRNTDLCWVSLGFLFSKVSSKIKYVSISWTFKVMW